MDTRQHLCQPDHASDCVQGNARPCLTLPRQRGNTTREEAQKEAEEKKMEAQRRIWFESGMKTAFKIPSGYVTIAVLAIRWDNPGDDYKDEYDKEVAELQMLFEGDFGFKFEEVRLHTSPARKPQHDLNAAIMNHVRQYDSPNSLLIIYYTGHGLLHGPENNAVLQLSASKSLETKDDLYKATAFWYKAEQVLLDSAEADVLAIFDCCYASNAIKGWVEQHRVYELIAASPKGYTTPAPGANSFTSHLIASLRELLKEHGSGCFRTNELVARINKKNKKPHKGRYVPAMLHDRLDKYPGRNIKLARMDDKAAELRQEIIDQLPVEAAHLDLRFSLQTSNLDREQIKALAPELRAAFENANIKLCRIDWDRLVQYRTYTLSENVRASIYARRWRKSYTLRTTLNSPVVISNGEVLPILERTISQDIVESPVALSDGSGNEILNRRSRPSPSLYQSLRKDIQIAVARKYRRIVYMICVAKLLLFLHTFVAYLVTTRVSNQTADLNFCFFKYIRAAYFAFPVLVI